MEKKEVKVTKPEDWLVATEIHEAFILQTLNRQMTFNLRAMSSAELRELEEQAPLPEAPLKGRRGEEYRDVEDQGYQERLISAQFTRWIKCLDKCWKPLPGTTLEEKVKWAAENLWRNGEITALWNEVRMISGLGMGKVATSAVAEEAPIEADPESWAKASQAGRLGYRIEHPKEILVFDMCGLSQLKVNQIREICRPPAPPFMMERHKITGKIIPGSEKPDYGDPGYQQALKDSLVHENCLLLEAALFTFPGSTKEEKRKWLDERPAYEVRALLTHLVDNVISYRDRLNF